MTCFALLLPACLVPLSDGMRFPPVEELRAACQFNQAYQRRLAAAARAGLAGDPDLLAAMAAARRHHRIYDDAWYVRDPSYSAGVRRQAMVRLIHAIGWGAYWRAELPPCVPSQYFVDVNEPPLIYPFDRRGK